MNVSSRMLALGLILVGAAIIVGNVMVAKKSPVSALDEIAPGKMGFIGCENGVPTIRNITISGLDIPEGKFLIDGTAMVCSGKDI